MKRPLALALLLALAAVAAAQSRTSSATVGAANLDLSGQLAVLDGAYSGSGGYVQATIAQTFSGLDRRGGVQAMTFDGFASAQSDFGRLKATARGSVLNTYYNPAVNAPYYAPGPDDDGDGAPDDHDGDGYPDYVVNEEGSPDAFTANAYAGFTDVLSFGQGANADYRAQYVFFVHGQASGGDVYSYLHAKIGNNAQETLTVDLTGGQVAQYWATQKYEIGSLMNQTAEVSFTTQYNPSVGLYAEGSDLAGSLAFSSTITLTAINVYDRNDRLVGGISITGASGTAYPVPEPASIAALGLGAAALLRRRRSTA